MLKESGEVLDREFHRRVGWIVHKVEIPLKPRQRSSELRRADRIGGRYSCSDLKVFRGGRLTSNPGNDVGCPIIIEVQEDPHLFGPAQVSDVTEGRDDGKHGGIDRSRVQIVVSIAGNHDLAGLAVFGLNDSDCELIRDRVVR